MWFLLPFSLFSCIKLIRIDDELSFYEIEKEEKESHTKVVNAEELFGS